ncbi:ATP-binding protein [Marinicella rhabdoformis]|uniref:AlbA family DNA-binding domain-containing protein n=1 Tax=Marinicella rhabdoformis TaxID=2580566 RepID=UPI0012AEB63E
MKKSNDNKFPDWANQELSLQLPEIISKGENQFVDFKEILERNERMAKEIASFATSNDGMIIIGVDDNDQIVGIQNAHQQATRKNLVERIEKICTGCVLPSVTPEFEFAVIGSHVLLAIKIKKGPEPVYYTNSYVPYLRSHSEARPAKPNEVYQLIKNHIDGVSTNTSAKA